ncbi:MAG: helix-turn-helix domain-containing protein [Chloroflexota bacterium]
MDEIGHILREARETKGLTLEETQEETRINSKYLAAMENGEYEKLPTPVHVRGFLRNYARFLGLDPQPLLERYEINLAQQGKRSLTPAKENKAYPTVQSTINDEQVFFDPVNMEVDVGQRRDPETAVRLVIIIALIIAVALIANRFIPLLMGNEDGSQSIDNNLTEFFQDITNRAQGTATAQSGDMLEGEAVATEPVFVPGEIITSTSRNVIDVTPPAMPITRPTLPTTLEEIQLQLDISERTWMEVTIDGDVVFSGWARGEDPPYEWTAQEEAKVNTGNGAGVFVTINDQPWGRMGERGENKEEVWRTTN